MADLTEVSTWEGKLYVAVVIDCLSRRVVGWSMRDDMRAELVVEALEMAVLRRKPAAGLVHHSDQGAQYVSLVFGERCWEAGIDVSMGAKGSALDNAVCESFLGSLKKELVRRFPAKTGLTPHLVSSHVVSPAVGGDEREPWADGQGGREQMATGCQPFRAGLVAARISGSYAGCFSRSRRRGRSAGLSRRRGAGAGSGALDGRWRVGSMVIRR